MKYFLLCSITLVFLNASCKKEQAKPTVDTPEPTPVIEYSFDTTAAVWSDEFDNTGLPDATKWGYDVGGSGWGNNELQYYSSDKNAEVKNGKLIIEARKEEREGKNYTSARLVTKNKGDFTYGRLEVKAKLPSGRGSWPAIWMLATNQTYSNVYWPDNGEIDVMEHVGYDPGVVHFSIHCKEYNWPKNTQRTSKMTVPTAMSDFHVYRMDWTPRTIKGYIDGKSHFEFTNDNQGWTSWPFDQKFHLLLNIAVGGNWGGAQGVDDSIFPQRMEIDYVRVYKLVETKK